MDCRNCDLGSSVAVIEGMQTPENKEIEVLFIHI